MSFRSDVAARPGLTRLLGGSWLWHFTRFGGLFCGSYLATKSDASSFLTQIIGAMLFAPMIFGVAGGSFLAKRSPLRVVIGLQVLQLPALIGMAVLVATGHAAVWMLFPYMLVLGLGAWLNMTAQRTLIADVAGPALAVRCLAIDSVSVASAMMLGPVVCGAVIGAFGRGAGFVTIAAAQALAIVAGQRLPVHHEGPVADETPKVGWAEIVALLRRRAALVSVVAITAVADLLYFSFMPLVPKIAEHFGANATITGALGGAAGFGSFLGASVIASIAIRRLGRVFVVGTAVALFALGVFAAAPILMVAFVALFLSGVGNAGFTATQSGLTIESVPLDERPAAMGVVAVAIGAALPVGMVLLGVAASLLGPRAAVVASAALGLVLLGLVLRAYPGVLELDEERVAASEVALTS